MTEEQFWEKIDAANPGVPTQAFLDRLYELLLNLSLEEIRGFYVTGVTSYNRIIAIETLAGKTRPEHEKEAS